MQVCAAMSHPPSSLSDRLSPMPMVCPLVKLGRASPPITDQGYHTALETQTCHHTANDSSKDYNLGQDQNYHDNGVYHSMYPSQAHMYADIYSKLKKELPVERCLSEQHFKAKSENIYQHRNNQNFMQNPYISSEQGMFHNQHRIDSLSQHQLSEKSTEQYQYSPLCEQASNHSSSSLDCDQLCQQKISYFSSSSSATDNVKMKSAYGHDQDYQHQKNMIELASLSVSDNYWGRISNKSLDQSEIMCRHSDMPQDYYEHNQQKRISSPTVNSCSYIVDNFNKMGKSSPNLDQGYHTLVSPSPGPSTPSPWTENNMGINLFKGKKLYPKNNSFDRLEDDIVLKIFSWLNSYDLSMCTRVCRRFENLAWRPSLWRTIVLNGENISGDKAIRAVLRQLCGQGRTGACPNIERVYLSDGAKLTDRALILLARRCPELTHLQLHGCTAITNPALFELVTRCMNLQHLDITGCTNITCISITSGSEPPRRLLLQYLDLTDCPGIEDNGLRIIVRNCPLLVYLYLRRCIQITDAGLKYVPSFCSGLRELSVSDCSKVTDFGLYELAKLGATLRYLSVAKCDQVSDAGLKVIARRCYKLRYLNARGCEAVSDDAITVLARSCTRLRALDIGKCDVSDAGLRALAESCPNIKKLSLRSCDLVTDRGVQCVAYYCRGLQQLNIQDCQISLEGYRAVKKYCKRCVIEHTNPGFF